MKVANTCSRVLLLALLVVTTGCVAEAEKRASPRMLVCAAQGILEIRSLTDGDIGIKKVGDLPEDSDCPIWSPDGKSAILYRIQDHGRFLEDSLSYLNLKKNAVIDTYQFKPRDVEWSIQWSSDKADLLLTSGNDAESHICNNTTRSLNGVECWISEVDIFTSTLDTVYTGGKLQQLTHSPSPKCELVWSPDGLSFAYVSGDGCIAATTQTDIVMFNLSNQDSVTIPGVLEDGSVVSGHAPRWSPNGKDLLIDAFLLTPQGEPKTPRILITTAENQKLRPIGPELAVGGYWSHDSKSVFWWIHQDNIVGITHVDTGYSQTWDIPNGYRGAIRRILAWSPNGRFVAWTEEGDEENKSSVLILDLQLGQISVVPNLLAESLAWSPDNKYLSFTVHTPDELDSCKSSLDIYIVGYDGASLQKANESMKLEARKCSTTRSVMNKYTNEIQWLP